MSVSDLSDRIPVPKPRARYLLGIGASTSDGVGPDVQGDTKMDFEEVNDKHNVSVEEPFSQQHTISASTGLQENATSIACEDFTVIPVSPKSLNESLSKQHQNSNKAGSADQMIDVQIGLVRSEEKCHVPKSQKDPEKPNKPRAATIRVSRRKQTLSRLHKTAATSHCESVVAQSSWLDVWRGRKHNVLWATLDGQLMSLWKKRTDKFTEYVFHVTSITNICRQNHGHFSIYFRKKHFEFMAHSEAVQKGWVSSLLASRGGEPVDPPKQHGPLTMKDPRKKVHAAICGHNLWIYSNKEDFSLGLGMTYVSMNIASVKLTGRHAFCLITPYRTFYFSAETAKETTMWLDCLNDVIRSALSCNMVANRLWLSPWNKYCADCRAPNPEWASVNLLVVICEDCAGEHRSMGSSRSKVRSLKLDNKVWTEPLIQLFVLFGNKSANGVWGHNITPAEQIGSDVSREQRAVFILSKYQKGLYRKTHPLASSQKLLNQRLLEVVSGPNVDETLSLLCSGARVLCTGTEIPSAISIAESSGQALQTELLRHNEFVEATQFDKVRCLDEEMEELHGKLDEERFLFSQENESAACDVLDLMEVISVFDCSTQGSHAFEMFTLTDRLTCSADGPNALLEHMLHVMKILLGDTALDADLEGVCAMSRASVRQGASLDFVEVWCTLQTGMLNIFTRPHCSRDKLLLGFDTRCYLHQNENCIMLQDAERILHIQFELQQSCLRWYELVQRATCSTTDGQKHTDAVPCAIDRCISHITQYGLKVEGLYRRCGIAPQVSKLVDTLHVSPREVVLGTDEYSILDVTGALKQILRQTIELVPQKQLWLKAAVLSDEMQRLQAYRKLVNKLPPENFAILAALCEHLHNVQCHSHMNLMTTHNLAVVFVATLFQELAINKDMIKLTRELIMHHTMLFMSQGERDEKIITVF
ncbi:arf-GAP with Rho-GAP domain, ANK repeat and PH domain-containing protein 2 isoform X2 [Triplophysa dalaica]|uniref:arf-GAP with Rho-GAP domain, ANK repeat and PH domain-containing protein 2 isoform X2 n=1 Tax=Triplophysa dalaica TaxID=1582913 RepID=UPI0024DF89FC|nr:arf-GAP with Rho-GAP domain, ANK repeat and PH domain-containing protein 2 isoform X2 [Triplophysa dalaica]